MISHSGQANSKVGIKILNMIRDTPDIKSIESAQIHRQSRIKEKIGRRVNKVGRFAGGWSGNTTCKAKRQALSNFRS